MLCRLFSGKIPGNAFTEEFVNRRGFEPWDVIYIDPRRSKQTWELYMGRSSSRYRRLYRGCAFKIIKKCDRGKADFELRDPDW